MSTPGDSRTMRSAAAGDRARASLALKYSPR